MENTPASLNAAAPGASTADGGRAAGDQDTRGVNALFTGRQRQAATLV
jgi:hypothetical protein